ncbi:uncharacterized protein LOC131209977 [Anopheles bellator]|uniref:uncharacterized protein LOC131209977 n=1 Tax=Anopheles bellator TaxID=139047 RepID=UPI00264A4010|nr:uncharacterized protein LOC131209977 [Anopheles bellator]
MMDTFLIQFFFGLTIVLHNAAGDDMGLLSSTLRAFRTFCCDDDLLTLSCPIGTSISVELVQYGAKEENDTVQCSYSELDGPYYAPEPPPSSSPTSIMDIVLPNNNILNAMNESITNSSVDRTKDKCTPLYVLQYSILQTIVETCQKKRRCRLHAAPKIFETSPCPGIHRLVEVNHKCRPFEFRSLTSCEKDIVRLTCGQYTRIAIYSATYGRTAYESSHCSQAASSQEQTCLSEHTSHTLTEICQGRRKCTVAVESSTFGNPCPESIRVYLKVIYACVSRNVFRERYITPLEDDELNEQPFESVELYDEELTPVPNQVEDSAAIGIGATKSTLKYLSESSRVKAENIVNRSKGGELWNRKFGSPLLDEGQLLIVSVAVLFFCCICLSFGALLAYKMKLFPSRTATRCIKASDSTESHSTPSSYRPTSDDFDLVDCGPDQVIMAEKLTEQQSTPNQETEATSSLCGTVCTSNSIKHPAFTFGDVEPGRGAQLSQISTTMFILPNYLMTEAPVGFLSNNRRPSRLARTTLDDISAPKTLPPSESLTITLAMADITSQPGSYTHPHHPQQPNHQHQSAYGVDSCSQCAVLGLPSVPPTGSTPMYGGMAGPKVLLATGNTSLGATSNTTVLHPYQHNQSLKSSPSDTPGQPEVVELLVGACDTKGAEITLTKSNSFLWLGLKIGLM